MVDTKASPSAHEPPAVTARPELLGRVLSDRYRVDSLVASGAFGSVYRGVHLHMRKEVAIKILHPEIENFRELVERFEREAIAGAHVTHPNVAAASDFGKFDGDSYFLVQEYIRGETLREPCDRGPLAAGRAARIARQIGLALSAVHRRGIVHRDLKPTNVMLVAGTDDFVKLIDFGFARVPVGTLTIAAEELGPPSWEGSQAGVVFGTVAYLAPEAALGMQSVSERSDLYALGILLYEMLAGRHPFDVTLPAAELFAKHRFELPPRIADLDPALERIVQRLLAKDPNERFADAAGLVDALDQAMARDRVYRARSNPDSVRPSRWLSAKLALPAPPAVPVEFERRRPRWIGVAVAGLVAGVLAVVALSRSAEEAPPAPSSAAAEPSAAPAPPPSASTKEPFERRYARARKAELVELAASGDIGRASEALLALVAVDSDALDDSATAGAAAKLLPRLAPGGTATDKVFYALAHKAGPAGLDVLYRVLESTPDSAAARRAHSILVLQAASERASPGLRVTWELRQAACKQKPFLFERAAKQGDERTLRLLRSMRVPVCHPKTSDCCLASDLALDQAIDRLAEKSGSANALP